MTPAEIDQTSHELAVHFTIHRPSQAEMETTIAALVRDAIDQAEERGKQNVYVAASEIITYFAGSIDPHIVSTILTVIHGSVASTQEPQPVPGVYSPEQGVSNEQ